MESGEKKTVDVIIPVYQPSEEFSLLLERLMKQSILPEHVILMYTLCDGESADSINEEVILKSVTEKRRREESGKNGTSDHDGLIRNSGTEEMREIWLERLKERLLVFPVKKSDFDHGATRDAGAKKSQADYLLFMTQDALPADDRLLRKLLEGMEQEGVGISYARQLPKKSAGPAEQLTRYYNYPKESRLQTKKSISTLGIKAFFCSDVCAMYDRKLYERLGGFVSPTIFCEDSIMASKVLEADYAVYYAASARVFHSHEYTCMQQFHRNFDMGVSHRQYREIFETVSSEKEGAGFAKKVIAGLLKRGHFFKAVYFAWQCGFRLAGYRLGKGYEKLPHFLVMKCTASKGYVLFQKKQ